MRGDSPKGNHDEITKAKNTRTRCSGCERWHCLYLLSFERTSERMDGRERPTRTVAVVGACSSCRTQIRSRPCGGNDRCRAGAAMRALTAGPSGEIFSETAQRLLRWGMIEREAYMLARCVRLAADATDTACEDAVILALVAASEAVSGRADVTLVGGRRCDVQRRLEGRA